MEGRHSPHNPTVGSRWMLRDHEIRNAFLSSFYTKKKFMQHVSWESRSSAKAAPCKILLSRGKCLAGHCCLCKDYTGPWSFNSLFSQADSWACRWVLISANQLHFLVPALVSLVLSPTHAVSLSLCRSVVSTPIIENIDFFFLRSAVLRDPLPIRFQSSSQLSFPCLGADLPKLVS